MLYVTGYTMNCILYIITHYGTNFVVKPCKIWHKIMQLINPIKIHLKKKTLKIRLMILLH